MKYANGSKKKYKERNQKQSVAGGWWRKNQHGKTSLKTRVQITQTAFNF